MTSQTEFKDNKFSYTYKVSAIRFHALTGPFTNLTGYMYTHELVLTCLNAPPQSTDNTLFPNSAMVRQFHDGMQACVQNDGEFSEPFEVTNGVKQGCVLAPTLFSMKFSAMLMDAFQDQSGTVLMATYSTSEGCKPKLRCRLMC